MAVTVVCPACGGRLNAPSQLIGRMAKCPQCGQTVKIAASTDSPAEPPRPVPSRKPKSSPSKADRGAAQVVIRRSDDLEGGSDDAETAAPSSRRSYGLGIPLVAGIIIADPP